MTEREFAIDVVRTLRAAGHQALWAGGCVRDQLLGHEPHDYDVATDALPDQVQQLFRRTIAVGASFGVIEVLGPKSTAELLRVQVATFRSDVSYSDGRHPDSVVFSNAEEDAKRRDFTINGMFFDPLEDNVIDYVGGQDDLSRGILRAIGDAKQRFTEDKLRLLRAVRFATRFNFALDPTTADAIRAMADQITVVSAERIADELRKLLAGPRRAEGMRLMKDADLAAVVLPEAGASWEMGLRVLELLPDETSFPLSLAALLRSGDRRSTGKVCSRLRLSNEERERVEWLVEMHDSLCNAPQLPMSKLKPILAHPGISELLALHRANALASGQRAQNAEFCEQKLREWTAEVLNPPPLITGDDLRAMGLTPGPLFKRLLDAVRVEQLDERINAKEAATELVRRLLSESA